MVPKGLRNWFVIHFVADMITGVPLLLVPGAVLGLFGWETDGLFAFRIVGAALLGIGWESLLGKDGGLEKYQGMLRLKLIWAGSAIVGMSFGILNGEAPAVAWIFVLTFVVFFVVWAYYARKLSRLNE